jgi:acyl carrier protein
LSIRETLRRYISEELLEDDAPVDDDENLLADGMVDSLGMLRLVGFIEESYGFRVPPDAFTIEHFRTIATLDAYLSRAMNAAGQETHAG